MLPTADRGRDTLLVFARAPRPGEVKSRLAADIGDEEAARLYATMGRGIVKQVADGSYRTIVVHDPPEAGQEIANWLGDLSYELRPQQVGDLGERLTAAIHDAFLESDRVVVIGTDSPEITSAVIEEAFIRLHRCDLVIGPSFDGGFYLLGVTTPIPSLLREVPWSSGNEREEVLRRARMRDLDIQQMSPRIDVDTVEDLEKLGTGTGVLIEAPRGTTPGGNPPA